jgi:HEAT repeat protein
MSSDPSRSPGPQPAELPPVEPPSAGFLIQLFVVPGVIVVVVVLIWVLFNWLAQKGNDRDAFVRALGRNNEARWQAAFNLANAMRSEHGSNNPTLINDPQLARQLAEILQNEIKDGSMEENSISLRIYLSRALGEFTVPEGLPTLIEAATTVRDEKEADVRRAALEGIALLADNVGPKNEAFANNQKLDEVLVEAASDSDPRTRSVAAVTLGIIGTPAMLTKLEFLLGDANPDVRYNAALRLAQHGNVSAIPVLLEMLDPNEKAGVEAEQQKQMQDFKRALITINALRASGQLAEANHDADLSQLRAAIEKLLEGDISQETRVEATSALNHFGDRGEAAASSPAQAETVDEVLKEGVEVPAQTP